MATTERSESASRAAGLRERLNQGNERLTVLATAEVIEKLTALPQSLNDTGDRLARALNESAEQSMSRLSEIAEAVRHGSQETTAASTRLAELQRSMREAERNLSYQVERLKREADRAQWIQTGVILLALTAGILGGIGATLVILTLIR